MDISLIGFDTPFFHNLHHILEATDDANNNNSRNAEPTRAYVCDARAMAATLADVKKYPNSYVFIVDMPGLKSGDIKVQVEDENVLVISGERKNQKERKVSNNTETAIVVAAFILFSPTPEGVDQHDRYMNLYRFA
ncbi:hypothetical protein L6452_05285 [Arctium lappa]|uniref:Uncharacterized protein n=1 Tax=Arctium lappa TaxID=4217 RepID=A0ACB9EFZ8_ARCLA|nr:hypothetical protein L6452_05285 [Arctium lappa]